MNIGELGTTHLFALAAALGWASGLRLYAVVFLTGMAGALGWVELPAGLQVLQQPALLWASGALVAVEFLADKVPWIDSAWDALHTFIRIPGGAALAWGVFGGDQAGAAVFAALLGGTLAATAHLAKATTRAAVNHSPEPFSNIGLSLAGDALVPAMLWLAWTHPWWFAAALVAALAGMLLLTTVLFRFLRGLWHSLRLHFTHATGQLVMFTKILIANRGEIACRVAATARRLGITTVAVYSDADSQARHVLACDEAVGIGGAAPADSYLRAERIVEAALAHGAQAVHPGYGFLSENAAFADACAKAGLVFIGPPPAAIAAMGSKSAAKALMQRAGVPLVPGYHGDDNGPAFLQAEAQRIGFPVLIKASAGGGGKGMRRVDRAADFAAALAGCQREALAGFGDAQVLVERYVTRPRHIEVQVFADAHGGCVHLFERDCSVQRRHQKLLEESPAPGLTPERRAEMGAAAVAAARAVGYVGAGTVEFIAEPAADGDLRFYFMEMNTRLQVEHPVTEAVTGLDLVEWQLRVAAGERLPLQQADLRQRGHAIEARVCAENAQAGFLPSTGALQVLRWPPHVAFERSEALPRVDSGFAEGDEVTPHYDPMIAKLIVWGEDRAQALARLDAALRATLAAGPHTNAAFLRRVAATRSFSGADLDTALLEREQAALSAAAGPAREWALAGALAWQLDEERRAQDADPWSRRDAWRLGGRAVRRFEWTVDGRPDVACLEPEGAQGWTLLLEPDDHGHAGGRWPFAAAALGDSRHELRLGGQAALLTVLARGNGLWVFDPRGERARLEAVDPLQRTTAAVAGGALSAPMPGRLVAYHVAVGDAVRAGQPLAVIEAMKMEHSLLRAPHDGTVAALLFAVGDRVPEGQELLRIDSPASV